MEKADLSNQIFAKQCSLVHNPSKFAIESSEKATLSTIPFSKNHITRTTKILNPSKAHGY